MNSQLMFPPPAAPLSLAFWVALAGTILSAAADISLLLWVKRRIFYRTNNAGVQYAYGHPAKRSASSTSINPSHILEKVNHKPFRL